MVYALFLGLGGSAQQWWKWSSFCISLDDKRHVFIYFSVLLYNRFAIWLWL